MKILHFHFLLHQVPFSLLVMLIPSIFSNNLAIRHSTMGDRPQLNLNLLIIIVIIINLFINYFANLLLNY